MEERERNRRSPPSPDSSSASASPSQGARASVSGHDVLEALVGIERDLRSFDRRLESIDRVMTHTSTRLGFLAQAQELDGRRISAMRIESAASLSRIEAATRALHSSADEAAKAAKQIREDSAEFKTQPRESEEQIAKRVLWRLAKGAVLAWAGKHAAALVLGALALVGAALWAYVKSHIH